MTGRPWRWGCNWSAPSEQLITLLGNRRWKHRDELPIHQGQPLLGDDGRPMTTAEFLDQLRIHPVYGFLFQQRGAMGAANALAATSATAGGFGEVLNPHAMSASELYRAGFVTSGRSPRS